MARDAVAEVRERTDVLDLVGGYVQLRKAGRSFKGLCPFHQERTPSFVVFPESGTFRCFGCGKGGDVFTFYQEIERVDFREALTELARRAGVALESVRADRPEVDAERKRLLEINEVTAAFFHYVLLNTDAGAAGRELAERRGLDAETIRRFRVGFAPDSYEALLRNLRSRGFEPEQAVKAGVLSSRDDGRVYDRFRGRLMFPIANRDGEIVGFGGRALGDGQPKYLNSPQSDIFDKSTLLYGAHLAREASRERERVVIVEGYMDAITAHQFGHGNVVASMGTAVTEAQVGLAKRLAATIVLALDADAAGQMATVRGLETARDALDYDDVPVAIGPGVVQWQQKLKTEIRVATLPIGKDPDELIRRAPETWDEVIGGARPVVDWLIDAIASSVDTSDAASKSTAVQRLLPILRQIPDRVQLHHYADIVARRLGTVPQAVLSELTRASPKPRRTERQQPDAHDRGGERRHESRPSPAGRRTTSAHKSEDYLTALLLGFKPHLGAIVDELPEELFDDARNREIVRSLRAPETGDLSGYRLVCGLPEELAGHGERLLRLVGVSDEDDEGTRQGPRAVAPPKRFPGGVRREVLDTVERIERERFTFAIRQVNDEIRSAQADGDVEALADLQHRLSTLLSSIQRFDPPPSTVFRDTRSPWAS